MQALPYTRSHFKSLWSMVTATNKCPVYVSTCMIVLHLSSCFPAQFPSPERCNTVRLSTRTLLSAALPCTITTPVPPATLPAGVFCFCRSLFLQTHCLLCGAQQFCPQISDFRARLDFFCSACPGLVCRCLDSYGTP
jgi:hypothetical protein